MIRVVTIIIFLRAFITNAEVNAQDFGRFWCFGDSAGIDFSDLSIPAPITSFMDCAESCSTVGDSTGLLMYAHTDYWPLWIQGYRRTTVIHNKYHEIIKFGDSLVGDAFHNGMCFLPMPDIDSLFYLFHWGFYGSGDSGLFYSVVNPYFNNDSGIVVIKNVALPTMDWNLQSGVSCIRHGNGRDWWVMLRSGFNSNRIYSYLVSSNGINSMPDQLVGTVTNTDVGFLEVSKLGNKMALVNFSGLIETYDFDRCTGILSNPRTIYNQPSGVTKFFGCAFSPDERFLYVSNCESLIWNTRVELFQLDLFDPNSFANRTLLFADTIYAQGGNLRLGPDDKIYWACNYGTGWKYTDTMRSVYNENLSVINNPNGLGLTCNFSPFSFYLGGKRSYWNLPNNANFTLRQSSGTICDSLFSSVNEIKKPQRLIYPNPTSGNVEISTMGYEEMEINIYSSNMSLIQTFKHIGYHTKLNLNYLSAGIYFIKLNNNEIKKLIILK